MTKITVASILLILVNVGFIVAGYMLLNFTSSLEQSGWIDALEGTEYHETGQKAASIARILGYATIAIAILGAIGAIIRNRVVLLVYSIIMIAVMTVFGVIAMTANSFKNKASTWEEAKFPAEDQEQEFATKFNEAYCFAQGAYFCNNATVHDVVKIFVPTLPEEALGLLPKVNGINEICEKPDPVMMQGLDSVCKTCKQAKKFAKYDKILAWAEEKCPRTSDTGLWCAQFLATSTPGDVIKGSPYGECRGKFLNLAVSWSSDLFILGIGGTIGALVIIGLSCAARRSSYASGDRFSKA